MERMSVTYHAGCERMDRYMELVEKLGGVAPIIKVKPAGDGKLACLTENCIVIIKGSNNELITFYIAEKSQLDWFYNGKTPYWALCQMKKNIKKLGKKGKRA